MIYTAGKKCQCVLCGKDIPAGHRYWKAGPSRGRQHINCVEYETPIYDFRAQEDLDQQLAKARLIYFSR